MRITAKKVESLLRSTRYCIPYGQGKLGMSVLGTTYKLTWVDPDGLTKTMLAGSIRDVGLFLLGYIELRRKMKTRNPDTKEA